MLNKRLMKTLVAGLAAMMLAGGVVGCGNNAANESEKKTSETTVIKGKIALAGIVFLCMQIKDCCAKCWIIWCRMQFNIIMLMVS